MLQTLTRATAKAVYYPDPITGQLTLARVHTFNKPLYTVPFDHDKKRGSAAQYDTDNDTENDIDTDNDTTTTDARNVQRAARRARRRAFDLIMCNSCLNTFVTLTYDPDKIPSSGTQGAEMPHTGIHEAVYPYLRTWLSNGVQRRGLCYVCVPERHKKGGIHWHALCNSEALPMVAARSAKTGRLLRRNGETVFNVTNWSKGFSTALQIRQREEGNDPRAAVAKYMFKYMTKNFGAKVGGRYMLHGGQLVEPVEVYGMGIEEFGDPAAAKVFEREVDRGDNVGLVYREYDFLHGFVGAGQ